MRISIMILVILSPGYLLHAQNDNYLRDHPGKLNHKFTTHDMSEVNLKFTKAEEQLVKSKLEAIVRYMQSSDGFSNPKGVEIYAHSELCDQSPLVPWLNSLTSKIYVEFHPWFMDNGEPKSRCGECSVYFTIHINKPEYVFYGTSLANGGDLFDTDGALINAEPAKIVEQDGAILYENGIIVISKPGKPVWLPMTVRQYDNLLLERQKKMIKEKPEESFTYQFFMDKLKEEMSSFSETELDKPAYQYGFGGSPNATEGMKPIVKLNKAYFDQSKPRSAVQLIIIEYGGLQNMPEDPYLLTEYSTYQHIKLVEALRVFKYSGLRDLIDKNP